MIPRLLAITAAAALTVWAIRRALAATEATVDYFIDEPEGLRVETKDSGIMQVDWSRVRYFKPAEFRGELDDVDPAVVYAADELRHLLGSPLIVSPAPGAIARKDGNPQSQHYAVGRRSTALDLMPQFATLRAAYDAAKRVRAIGGIGLYPQTLPRPMIHIDTRARKPGGQVSEWMGLRRADGGAGWQYAGIDWRVVT